MEATELERRCAALKARCAKLAAEDQERVLDAWAQVLVLCELPREPGETIRSPSAWTGPRRSRISAAERSTGAHRRWPDHKLKTVTRTQGNNQALKDGTVKPRGFEFDFVEVDPLIAAFRRMVRGLEFDVCEMAITTYICARAHGKRMTAMPVFLVRAFHHGAILVNAKAGIETPKDLEGKRVGVNRGYTVTTGRVGARRAAGRARRRSRQDHLGALRRRARRGVPAAGQRGADRARARRWPTCWSSGELAAADRRRGRPPGREAADPQRAGGRPRRRCASAATIRSTTWS